jgi:hypothetical protein
MEKITIKINTMEDALNGKPLIEGKTPEQFTEADNITVGILEKGMASGRSSLMVLFEMPDGSVTFGQITPDQLEGINAAFKGAEERFSDNG